MKKARIYINRLFFAFASSSVFSLVSFIVLLILAVFNIGPRWMWMTLTCFWAYFLNLVDFNLCMASPYRSAYTKARKRKILGKEVSADELEGL